MMRIQLERADQLRQAAERLARDGNQQGAKTQFDAALDGYVEASRISGLPDSDRAAIDLRLAQCYWGLLRTGVAEDPSWLQDQIVAAVESAAGYLPDGAQSGEAQSLINHLSAEPWWGAAVDRQQS